LIYIESPKSKIRKRTVITLIILAVCAALILAAFSYYTREVRHIRSTQNAALEAIANLKVDQINEWRHERFSDAAYFSSDPIILDYLLQKISAQKESRPAADLTKLLKVHVDNHRYYNIYLVGPDKQLLWSYIDGDSRFPQTSLASLSLPQEYRTITFSDFYIGKRSKRILIDVISPVFDPNDPSKTIGLMVFNIDPQIFLFPLVEKWPVPSETAETVMFRQDGDSIVFINHVRHVEYLPMSLRIPMDNENLTYYQACRGYAGLFEGVDYRGIRVMSHMQGIPGTNWKISSEIDRDEVYKDITSRSLILLAFSVLIIALTAILLTTISSFRRRKETMIALDMEKNLRLKLEENEKSLQRNAEFLSISKKISQAILDSIESPRAVAENSLGQLKALLESDYALYLIIDPKTQDIQLYEASDIRAEQGSSLREFIVGILNSDDQSIKYVSEAIDDCSKSDSGIAEFLLQRGIHSCVNILLHTPDKLTQVLNIGWVKPRVIVKEEMDISKEIAKSIAVAMEYSRLMQTTILLNSELESRVHQRTSELQTVYRELGFFAYTVGHDLRSPLRAVHGFASILMEEYNDVLDQEGRRLCQAIIDNGLKMGLLIDDLLDFSRLSRQEMKTVRINMEAMAREVMNELTKNLDAGRIEWKAEDLEPVVADPLLIRQVWKSLLSNALKFSSGKEKAVIIIRSHSENGSVTYSITDNGVGFDMAFGNKLFGVFQRLHSNKDFEGTGVGLAIVQRIIQRHGGSVSAKGKVGEGATFTFSLPANPA